MNRQDIKNFLKRIGGGFAKISENDDYLRGFEDGLRGGVNRKINSAEYMQGWDDGFVYSFIGEEKKFDYRDLVLI